MTYKTYFVNAFINGIGKAITSNLGYLKKILDKYRKVDSIYK